MKIIQLKDIKDYLFKMGYDIITIEKGKILKIEGEGIKGYIVLSNFSREEWDFPYIYVDHKDCFDKESKCPLRLPLPVTRKQLEYLAERLRFWGSPEGFKISDEFEHEKYDTKYPTFMTVN